MGSDASDTTNTVRSGKQRWWHEFSGAFGDLGTFLPYVLGALTVAGLAPQGVLLGFGVALLGSGLFYGIPIAVQPMKAVAAVLLTTGLSAGEVAASGIILGLVLLLLACTGMLGRVAYWIPRSVSAGLQLGLGLTMALLGAELISETPWLGGLSLLSLLLLLRLPYCPAALVALAIAVTAGWLTGSVELPTQLNLAWHLPALILPSWDEVVQATGLAVLPQLPLTLTNAIIVTAALSRELFPNHCQRVQETNLALSSGLMNLLLTPFGALPMCHGAGGLQAQYRFGARSGAAPAILGSILLTMGLFFADSAAALLACVPVAAAGALLLFAGADLALSRRLFDAQPSCWPVIILTAALMPLTNPALALAAGWLAEIVRGLLVRAIRRTRY